MKHPWYVVEEIVIHALFTPKGDSDARMKIGLELVKVFWLSNFCWGSPSLIKTFDADTHLADLVGPHSTIVVFV